MYLVMTLEITVIIIKMSLKRVSELRRTNPTHGFINILLMITMDLEKIPLTGLRKIAKFALLYLLFHLLSKYGYNR